jgi:hypothetical protein
MKGGRGRTRAGLVDDRVLLGFKTFSVDGDVAQDDHTDLAFTPAIEVSQQYSLALVEDLPHSIAFNIFFGWLSPGVQVVVVVSTESLRHGRLPKAKLVDESKQNGLTHLQEPVGRLHPVGEGHGFAEDCWSVDCHFVVYWY